MNTKLLRMLMWLTMGALLFTACDDEEAGDPAASFTAATTSDAWHYAFTNSSNVAGTATWDLGNGQIANGDVVESYYPLAGEYTVILTLSTSSGVLTSEEVITIDETDAAFFAHPFFAALTGGLDNAEGKTWLMDKNLNGHYGLGPGAGDWSSYHAAAGGFRKGYGPDLMGYYDDELTFILDGFVTKFWTGADGRVVCLQPEQAKKSDYYKNGIDPEIDAGFEYVTEYAMAANEASPLTQGYAVSITEGAGEGKEADLIAITFTGDAPMNVFFDPGTVGNTWYVDEFSENHMTLYCAAAAEYDIDEKTRYYQIKMAAEGHLSQPATFTAEATVGTSGSVSFEVAHTGGAAIESILWDFADGNSGTGTSVSHTYSESLTYNVIATVTDAIGVISETTLVVTVSDVTAPSDAVVAWASFEGADAIEFSSMNGADSIFDDGGNGVLKAVLAWQWGATLADLGGELDLSTNSVVKFRVKGTAGQRLGVNLYNRSDFSAPYEPTAKPLQFFYTLLSTDTWEEVVFDYSYHPMLEDANKTGYYDDITIFLNPGDQPTDPQQMVLMDDFMGPALP